jgi:hypothetical protein
MGAGPPYVGEIVVGVHLGIFTGDDTMLTKLYAPAILLAGAALLAGCAENSGVFGEGNNLTTASVVESTKTDPACVSLASQIDTLKKEGIADKVAQAAMKKYKMTAADLAKADQLNKTNTDFQAKCSLVKPTPVTQAAASPSSAAPAAAATTQKAAPAIAPAVAKATVAQ